MVGNRVRRAPSGSNVGEWRARDPRWWAAVIDVWLVSSLVGGAAGALVTVALDTQVLGALIVAPILMAAEARTGRTPGKVLVGVKTRRLGGGPVGWRNAVGRRCWMLLPAVGLIPRVPSVVGELLFLAAIVGLMISIRRASDGRGWHDQVADTEVVEAVASARRTAVAGLVVLGLLLLAAVGWWFGSPSGEGRTFRSMPEVDAVRCHVVHDGWLYPHHERTVVLGPADEAFSGRFGPHRVTLDFLGGDSEYRIPGLEVRVASSGMTTGRSEGRNDRIVDVTTGPGLGELIIDCRPQGPDAT